jgi:phosphonatase-like hydrolase
MSAPRKRGVASSLREHRVEVDLVVLDIAGTTVQEHGLVYETLEQAVRAAGADVGAEQVREWMGADKHEAVRALLADPGPDEVDRVHEDFRRRLADAYRTHPPAPFPGVPETLAALREQGVKVALTTGFDRGITQPLLETVGWSDGVLDAVVCADEVPHGRPAPYMIFRAMERTGVADVARVLVAGDTVLDLQAGTNAGAGAVVGVLTGGVPAEALGAHRHTHLLPGVAELGALLGAPLSIMS